MNSPADNPLLRASTAPHGAVPFDRIRTEHFLPALESGILEAKAEVEAIKANTAPPTFENTIEALAFSGRTLSRVLAAFSHLSGANSNDDLRAIEEKIEVAAVRHGNDVMMDEKLFKRVKAVHDARDTLSLTGEQRMLLDETYKGFVRSGALLDAKGKQRFREIDEKMAELKTAYRNNTVKAIAEYKKVIDDEKELAGVPERAKNLYRAAAEKEGLKGKFLIPLSPPPLDILEFCENRGLREEIARAQGSVAWKGQHDNSQIVLDIVRLRQEAAELLGYKSHAAYVLDDRMAKTPQEVMGFLKKNEAVYRPAAEEYLQKVKDFAKATDGIADLKPWDMAYYGRKLKEKTYAVDMEAVRPYFDLEKVLDGVRQHAEKLFNINMAETKGKYPVYHPDVKVYEVTDKKSGEMIGLFYADYYARPGAKRSGAWMDALRNRGLENGQNKFAHVVNVCNFPKPAGGQPTLLSLDEVRTVFHEFGHGLHALLAQGDYTGITGTNVKWDFVELPSQLQENWAQQKEVLDTFARHHVTGAPLPADMIQKIRDADNFDAGYMGLRQTFLGLLDMKWHAGDPAKIKSAESLEDALIAESWLFPRAAGPMSTNFGHIFAGGYSAGYYSYKWAEVLEADIFEDFTKKGLYDRDTADRLRDTVYSKGGTEDPMDLFVKMMGRKPDPDALFRREGLTPPGNDNRQLEKKIKPPQP